MANSTGWQDFSNQWQPSSGDSIAASNFTSMETGIQSEFIARTALMPLNGVISGMTPTLDDTNNEIDIASGVAYVEGYKAIGSTSVDASGLSAGTYYAYIDPTETNEADAYKAKATIPTQGELLLAQFDSDGSNNLSSFTDMRRWGVVPGRHDYSDTSGALDTVFRTMFGCPVCLRCAQLIVDTCGTGAGPTYVDIHTGPAGSTASIWSNSSDRFTIAHDDTDGALVEWTLPDQNFKLTKDDTLEIVVDQAATDATGLHVAITYTYY